MFLAPGLIYVFRSALPVIFLLLTKLCFMALGHVLFLFLYKKKGRLLGVYKRLLFSTGLVVLTYVLFIFGIFSDIVISPGFLIFIMLTEVIVLIVGCRFLTNFKGYKRIAVQFANKDVVGLQVAVVTRLSEDDTGIEIADWQENRAFFNTHKEKSMWGYMETAFRQRYKKALTRSFWDQLVFNSIFFLIMGFLIRFDIVTLDRTNILKYSPMVISIVLNLTFGTQYLQMCFRHLDLPILYYQFFLGANLVKSIKNRYFYLIKRGFWAISMLGLGLLVLLWIGGLQIVIVDFIRLCLIYFLIYVIYETYHLAIYYLIQPYTIELTVKSPLYSFFAGIQSLFAIGVLFARSNVLDLAIPLVISLAVMLVILLVTFKVAPKSFRLRLHTKPSIQRQERKKDLTQIA